MIEINNLTKFPVDKRFFGGVAKKVLKGENRQRDDLSIAFVDPQVMQKLNKKYRNKDKATDVLSFGDGSDFYGTVSEVVICPAVVAKDTVLNKKDLTEELSRVLIHGILHVLGYDHELSKAAAATMNQKQDRYLSQSFKK